MGILLFGEKVNQEYLRLQQQHQSREEKRMTKNSSEVRSALEKAVVGQPQAIDAIIPFLQQYNAGFNPPGRPVGIILLLGPTGTGKTQMVESLAEIIHGTRKNILKVNCGEFPGEHDIAKILGAPIGYIGSDTVKPIFTQKKLSDSASEDSDLQIVLLDEIEKAASSFCRVMMNVFDKGLLGLGDNSTVNFQNTLIFMTSNIGSESIQKANKTSFGLEVFTNKGAADESKLHKIGLAAAKKRFLPEFFNRIDSVVTYTSLNAEAYRLIFSHMVTDFGVMTKARLGYLRNFSLIVTNQAADEIIKQGTSVEYGARELKRVFQRIVVIPLAVMVENGEIAPQSTVVIDYNGTSFNITVKP